VGRPRPRSRAYPRGREQDQGRGAEHRRLRDRADAAEAQAGADAGTSRGPSPAQEGAPGLREPGSIRPGRLVIVLALSAAFGSPASPEDPGTAAGGTETAYERSLALVRSALERRKDDPALLQLLGDVHFRRGRFAEAIATYEAAVRSAPRSPEPLLAIAESASRLEERRRAADAFQAALGVAPGGPQAWRARRGLAEIRFDEGRWSDSSAELRKAIADGDDSPETRYLLGRSLEAEARGLAPESPEAQALDREALAALGDAVRRNPAHAPAHYVMAGIHRRHGRQEEARASLEAFRRYKEVKTELERDTFEKAEPIFEARTAVRLSRIMFEKGDAPGALALVRHALSIEPRFSEALAFEGWIHLRRGDLVEAERCYRSVLDGDPRHAEALWNLGKVLHTKGDLEASSYLLRSMELRRNFVEGWEILARLASKGGALADRAEEFARRALELRPSASNFGALAQILFEKGNAEAARQVIAAGIEKHPGDPDLQAAMEAIGGKAR